jgi:hypothetical protein
MSTYDEFCKDIEQKRLLDQEYEILLSEERINMKFIKATNRDGEPCYIPISSIDRISILGEFDLVANEYKDYMVYCVQMRDAETWDYYDLAGPFDTRELAESAMNELVKGINYDD